MKMPFGKYKDQELENITISYLVWASKNLDAPELVSAINEEIGKRYVEGDLDLAFGDDEDMQYAAGVYDAENWGDR